MIDSNTYLNATALADAVNAGTHSAVSITEQALSACEADSLNAVIAVHRESALASAAAVDARIAAGEKLPMAGVPVIVKDNMCVLDHDTTACSKILGGFKPPYTATAVQQMIDAGAIVVANANMDEFAMGSSNETSFYGPVKHPVDEERIPGGSSGGSAAAVAAGIAPIALGSDTGGSIRQPASLCGCVGMKPTYGQVSRYGLLAFGSSLDQIGPLCRNIDDTALALQAMSGYDKFDSTSAERDVPDFVGALANASLKGVKVGYIASHEEFLSEDMRAVVENARKQLEAAGAELVPVELPHEKYAVAIYYILATGEASSNLSRYDGVHYGYRCEDPQDLEDLYSRSRGEGFGAEVKRRIMLGTYVLSAGYFDAYYKKAQKVRRKVCQDYDALFAKCDILMGLASPSTAFKRGEKTDDPLEMYLSDIFTIAANLAGVPALSMPYSKDENGLPIGLHLQVFPQWADAKLLSTAKAIETLINE